MTIKNFARYSQSVVLLTIVLSTSLVAGQEPISESKPILPVSLVVNIADKHGNPLGSITKDSIAIFEKETKSRIAGDIQDSRGVPLAFAIAIDCSGSNRDKVKFLREVALQIFESVDAPGNHGLLVSFDTKMQTSNGFISKDTLLKSLQKVQMGGGSAIHDAVLKTSQLLGKAAPTDGNQPLTRRILFVISDGEDNQSNNTKEEAIKAALQAHVTIVPIVLMSFGYGVGSGAKVMSQIADATGGRAIILNSPRDISKDLSRFLSSEYVVTFTPTSPSQNGTLRTIQIQLADPHLGVVKVPASF
jgi:VWFA-related protein